MEDAEHYIQYVAYQLHQGDAPSNILQNLVNLGIKIDIAFLVYSAGKILHETQ